MRFLEIFAAKSAHPPRLRPEPPMEFLAWSVAADVPSIGAVQPVHVATWIEAGTREAQPR
jgi:hypothetical protein